MSTGILERDKWFALIEEQEKSGLSASVFCKERNLKLSQMHAYRHKLKKYNLKADMANKRKFAQVQVKPVDPIIVEQAEIRLILRNGLQCILPSRTEIERIKLLVEALMLC